MLQITKKYSEKRAFITGAASGLGKAFAIHLAQDGWTVGITDLNKERLQKVKNQIEALGGTAHDFAFDVSNKVAYEQVVEEFLLQVGGIDLLINNAGVGDGGAFHEYSLENWEWMTRINLFGVVNGCFFFIKKFYEQKSGHIINIASAAGIANGANMSPYNATKAAVISLSDTLRYESRPYNIDISVVMPTFFKTNIMENARGGGAAQSFASKMIERSNLEAEAVALEILEKAGKGDFKIFLPKEARKIAFMKRFFPSIFDKQVFKMVEKLSKRR
ncbi:MAG: SDR family NAD(P)-dependent oxidoreductase [Saprospiraceae bacterium]